MSLFGSTENLTSLDNFVIYINGTTDFGGGPILGILILLSLTFLSFLIMKAAFSFDRAMVASGFFGFVLSIFLLYLGLINMTILVVANLMFAIFIYMVMKERGGEET